MKISPKSFFQSLRATYVQPGPLPRMPPSQSDPSEWFCTCERCRRYSPDGKAVSGRTWYRHNPGGKKAQYCGLTDEQIQAIDRIVPIQNVPRPSNGRKAQKRRHTENEEVSPDRSKRVVGSGSVSCTRMYAPQIYDVYKSMYLG